MVIVSYYEKGPSKEVLNAKASSCQILEGHSSHNSDSSTVVVKLFHIVSL